MNLSSKGVIFSCVFLLYGCGDGGGGTNSSDSTENNIGGITNNSGAKDSNSGGVTNNTSTSCNLSPPVCTLSVSPGSSSASRLASGTHFYIQANCNTSVSAGEWFEGKDKILTGQLDLNAYPTVETGYTLNIPYQFNYSNCAGSGSAKTLIFITGNNASTGGGNNPSDGGSTGGGSSSGDVSGVWIGSFTHSDGGDIERFKFVNTAATKLRCVAPYSLEYYDQFYLRWESYGNQIVKDVGANSSVNVDVHLQPQTVRGVEVGTQIRNVKFSHMTCS